MSKRLFSDIITPHISTGLYTRKQYICSDMNGKLLNLTLKNNINIFINSTKIILLSLTMLAY